MCILLDCTFFQTNQRGVLSNKRILHPNKSCVKADPMELNAFQTTTKSY